MATGREFVTESETSIYVWCTIKWNNNVRFQLTTINRSRRLDMREDTITSEPFYLMSMGNQCRIWEQLHCKIYISPEDKRTRQIQAFCELSQPHSNFWEDGYQNKPALLTQAIYVSTKRVPIIADPKKKSTNNSTNTYITFIQEYHDGWNACNDLQMS